MAYLQQDLATIDQLHLSSSWTSSGGNIVSGPTTDEETVSITYTIPAWMTANKAYVAYTVARTPLTGTKFLRVNGESINESGREITLDISQKGTAVTASLKFTFAANGSASASGTGGIYLEDIRIYCDYQVTACTAPSSFVYTGTYESHTDFVLANSNLTLTWSGAASGKNNAIVDYLLQQRTSTDGSTWGEWTNYKASTTASIAVYTAGTDGSYRQFRVIVRGRAGDGYYSNASGATKSLKQNTAPGKVASLVPSSTLYTSGDITLTWPAASDVDGHTISYVLMMEVGDGTQWGNVVSVGSTGELSISFDPREKATLTWNQYIRFVIYAVDALGKQGANVYSASVLYAGLPGSVAFVFPASENLKCISSKPVIRVQAQASSGGLSQTLYVRVDDGNWTAVKNLGVQAAVHTWRLTTIETGSHTISIKTATTSGQSTIVSVPIIVKQVPWERQISSGTVIFDDDNSHIREITEMVTEANARRAWFGLSSVSIDTDIGLFSNWFPQMQTIYNAINACYAAFGDGRSALTQERNYPTAATVNAIRTLIVGV